MQWLLAILLLMLGYLQFQLWVGTGSRAEIMALQQDVAAQEALIKQSKKRNDALRAEVDSLKNDFAAIEERARSDLGMIGEGELFFQIIESSGNE
jgi:cell division protein FtsB